MSRREPPRAKAWKPPEYDKADVYALKALAEGRASEHQQKMAFNWIITHACAMSEEPFRSDVDGGERETSYALGRQFVARQILKLVNMPTEIATKLRSKHG